MAQATQGLGKMARDLSSIDGTICENVSIGGKLITKPEAANLAFDSATVKNAQMLPAE
jgi:hypothetical protein